MTDFTHRDLCSVTAGILQAYHNMSKKNDEIDKETVERIIEAFNKEHDVRGAETPKPEVK